MIDNKIKTLLTVVKEGGYTKAAQELHLTQPAVSHHIRLLEKEFGIKIFKQDKKELISTPEGDTPGVRWRWRARPGRRWRTAGNSSAI